MADQSTGKRSTYPRAWVARATLTIIVVSRLTEEPEAALQAQFDEVERKLA